MTQPQCPKCNSLIPLATGAIFCDIDACPCVRLDNRSVVGTRDGGGLRDDVLPVQAELPMDDETFRRNAGSIFLLRLKIEGLLEQAPDAEFQDTLTQVAQNMAAAAMAASGPRPEDHNDAARYMEVIRGLRAMRAETPGPDQTTEGVVTEILDGIWRRMPPAERTMIEEWFSAMSEDPPKAPPDHPAEAEAKALAQIVRFGLSFYEAWKQQPSDRDHGTRLDALVEEAQEVYDRYHTRVGETDD